MAELEVRSRVSGRGFTTYTTVPVLIVLLIGICNLMIEEVEIFHLFKAALIFSFVKSQYNSS